jgi:serine/threonine protein kinase
MVMEYCPHGDLSNFIKHKKKIPEHMVVDIMSQILNGYNYLANLKILHRDLKPSNILRSGKIWKIADFGFSVRTCQLNLFPAVSIQLNLIFSP